MPVLKIQYDEKLHATVQAHRSQIQIDLEAVLTDTLAADPAKCQIIMQSSLLCSPMPVYVDLQFRANDYRTREVVAGATQSIKQVLQQYLNAGIRIRAFDIDPAVLHALDVEKPADS